MPANKRKSATSNKLSSFSYDLPSNVLAESTVLGIMLMDEEQAESGINSLSEDLFSGDEKRNILVFNAMQDLHSRGEKITYSSVYNALVTSKTDKEAGGNEYLTSLTEMVVSIEDLDHYLKILKEHLLLRRFLTEAHEIERKYAYGEVSDIASFVSASYQNLERIANQREVGEFASAEKIAEVVREQIKRESNRGNKNLTGVDTGFRNLNIYTHGWQKGDLIILAARPSVGKTALALNLMVNATLQNNEPVAFFSCEMGADQIMKRIIAARSRVDLTKILVGNLYGSDLQKVNQAIEEIKGMKLFIDDTANPKLGDLVAKAKKIQAQKPDLCLICVDYLNLLSTEAKQDSRANEVAMVTRALKELARTLKVPVLALSQLNRGVDERPSGKPTLSNLKESGAIEQDADIAILMSRPKADESKVSKFGAPQPEPENKPKTNDNIEMIEIDVAKNRNGKTGPFKLLFSKNITLFSDPSPEYEQNMAAAQGYDYDPDGE